MPEEAARARLPGASASHFMNTTLGPSSRAQPCSTGSIMRQGPHQDAEKSSTTSCRSPANDASVLWLLCVSSHFRQLYMKLVQTLAAFSTFGAALQAQVTAAS
jgi:hypothetical protein